MHFKGKAATEKAGQSKHTNGLCMYYSQTNTKHNLTQIYIHIFFTHLRSGSPTGFRLKSLSDADMLLEAKILPEAKLDLDFLS